MKQWLALRHFQIWQPNDEPTNPSTWCTPLAVALTKISLVVRKWGKTHGGQMLALLAATVDKVLIACVEFVRAGQASMEEISCMSKLIA